MTPAPDLNRELTRFIRRLAKLEPIFAHLRASRILFVAGESRRRSLATIRGLANDATGKRHSHDGLTRRPLIRVARRRVLYWISLRPLFFRASTPRERLRTILHELFHISPAFDGTLARERRHRRLPRPAYDAALRPLVDRAAVLSPSSLNTNGPVVIWHWLVRPPVHIHIGTRRRAVFDERHLYRATVEMVTPTFAPFDSSEV
ncbi:MAG: hypothetical protein HYY84_02985 [Deltaproteobacteria bacterium]|nr:hypothetical protein [Deltaproteobacteria bacterium]